MTAWPAACARLGSRLSTVQSARAQRALQTPGTGADATVTEQGTIAKELTQTAVALLRKGSGSVVRVVNGAQASKSVDRSEGANSNGCCCWRLAVEVVMLLEGRIP